MLLRFWVKILASFAFILHTKTVHRKLYIVFGELHFSELSLYSGITYECSPILCTVDSLDLVCLISDVCIYSNSLHKNYVTQGQVKYNRFESSCHTNVKSQFVLLFTYTWRENSWIHTFPKGIIVLYEMQLALFRIWKVAMSISYNNNCFFMRVSSLR